MSITQESASTAVLVTFFADVAAARKREERLDLGALSDRIKIQSASEKAKLPLLKLGRFGSRKTEKRSLRHDGNLEAIDGVEADYDGERMDFDLAKAKLVAAGIRSVIYTSPSHCDDAPRWRVLCPTSLEYAPGERTRLLSRLNGVLGGVVSLESWTLSQCYYFGRVGGNPSHRVEQIDGTCIDLREDLDATAIGRPTKPAPLPSSPASPYTPTSNKRLAAYTQKLLDNVRAARDGEKHHSLRDNAKALGGIAAEAGFTDDQAVAWLMDALAGRDVSDWKAAEATARWGLAAGRDQPIVLEDRHRPDGSTAPPPHNGPPPTDDPYDGCPYDEEVDSARAQDDEAPPPQPPGNPAVADFLSAITWASLEILPDRKLLGDFVTSSTRAFLAGSTGIGKTMFLYALVGGMASGHGFLHWGCDRKSKWLIVDGEMPQVLVKGRAADLLRRADSDLIPPHGVTIYSRDREDDFAAAFPHLGRLSPLNTEAGHTFIKDLINIIGGVDGIVFDNLMSLAPGDQKDEETWGGCIPLVEYLSRNGIAQIWADHTGHDKARQYGSSTKAWRFDALAMLTPLAGDNEPNPDELAFKLSFDKARRRTPDNWRDFAPQVVRLIDDVWSITAADRSESKITLSDKAAAMFEVIKTCLNRYGAPENVGESDKSQIAVSRKEVRKHLISAGWFSEGQLSDTGVHLGKPMRDFGPKGGSSGEATLSSAFHKDDHSGKPTRAGFTDENNTYRSLKRKGVIDFNKESVWRPS